MHETLPGSEVGPCKGWPAPFVPHDDTRCGWIARVIIHAAALTPGKPHSSLMVRCTQEDS